MRLTITSVIGVLAVLPAFAGMPVVNTGNSISARSAFGESVRDNVTVAPLKRVVARHTNSNSSYAVVKSDVDVLSPNLPSSNLWAENTNKTFTDTPLRMPRFDEVAVLSNEFELPDETLNNNFAVADKTPVTKAQVASELETTMQRMAEIDAKIAKLSDLQRRADDSVKRASVRQTVAMDDYGDNRIASVGESDVLVRSVERHTNTTKVQKNTDSLAGLSPAELRNAFRKTFLSENKHLSAMTDAYATDTGDTTLTTGMVGFTTDGNLSEMNSGIRPFEIKVGFRNMDSALSRENYTLLTTFAGIVVNDPKRAVQILIPKDATTDSDTRKLTARRLAIVEQVLRDSGVPEQRIMPVLSNRNDDGGLLLRNIDSTQYETLTQQQRNQFGKTTSKTYKSMTW